MIVVEESTEPRATTDIGAGWSRRFGCNEPVLDALVIPLVVVVGPELGQRPSQAGLTDEHQDGGPCVSGSDARNTRIDSMPSDRAAHRW